MDLRNYSEIKKALLFTRGYAHDGSLGLPLFFGILFGHA